MNTIYENLSKVARMSPRMIRNYHEQHLERCWCGNWINNFLMDFVVNKDEDERNEALNSLIDHHNYMKNSSDDEFFRMLRLRARKKLGLPRRPLVTRTRG